MEVQTVGLNHSKGTVILEYDNCQLEHLMDKSLLTSDDREWLARHVEASRLGLQFMLYDMFRKPGDQATNHAGVVPIWYEGQYATAHDVLRSIERKVQYSQIFEQWQARVYEGVNSACRKLSKFDARVLMVASGFDVVTHDEIYDAEEDAVSEARRDLYGDDEGHC